jgi:hypothetical protein
VALVLDAVTDSRFNDWSVVDRECDHLDAVLLVNDAVMLGLLTIRRQLKVLPSASQSRQNEAGASGGVEVATIGLVVAWLSLAAGANGGVVVAADVIVTGDDVAAWLSLAALDALTMTVRVAVPVRPLGSVTV